MIDKKKNHTDHNRSKVDWSKSCLHKFGILVIDFSSENRDITSLCEEEEKNESEYMQDEPGTIFLKKKLTPYDSPAMWNALPLNLLKFSKNIETKAAISLAASSVVP